MSAATQAALDEAVRAHVADENDGAVVTGWVLNAEALVLGEDMAGSGERLTHYDHPDGQSIVQTLGLAVVLADRLRRNPWDAE